MPNSVSFSDPHLTVSPENKHDKKGKATRQDSLLAPGDKESSAQPTRLPQAEDAFGLNGTPIIRLITDKAEDAPVIFVPSAQDEDAVERLNRGRDWTKIEDAAVHKEQYRLVLGELLYKRGNQLTVGEQDKSDEENIQAMTKDLQTLKVDETRGNNGNQQEKPAKKNLSFLA